MKSEFPPYLPSWSLTCLVLPQDGSVTSTLYILLEMLYTETVGSDPTLQGSIFSTPFFSGTQYLEFCSFTNDCLACCIWVCGNEVIPLLMNMMHISIVSTLLLFFQCWGLTLGPLTWYFPVSCSPTDLVSSLWTFYTALPRLLSEICCFSTSASLSAK